MALAEAFKPDFGTKMKRQREERGITLRQIADSTKISVGALEALERSDITRLPGGIFSRAIVRSYAIEIGLDPEHTVKDFLAQFPHDSVTAGSPHVVRVDRRPDLDSKSGGKTMTAIAAALVISVIIGAIWYLVAVRN